MRRVNIARIGREDLTQKNVIKVAAQVQAAIISIETTKIARCPYYVLMTEQDLEALFKESAMEARFYEDVMARITDMANVIKENNDAETFTNLLSESINRLFDFIQKDTLKRRNLNADSKSNVDNPGQSPTIRRGDGSGRSLAQQFPSFVKFRSREDGDGSEEN